MSETKIYCPECGVSLPENARFCSECGAAIPNVMASDEPDLPSATGIIPTMSGVPTQPLDWDDENDQPKKSILEAGDVVADKFTIDSMIGRGGMGAVYLATENASGERVALKVISSSQVQDEKAVARLLNEGRLTRKLNHPNIVSIYDLGRHNDMPYIAMEYIEGVPLHVWRSAKTANGEPVSGRVAARIIKEVLDGLEVAHKHGVIHRDLKPENIMLLGEPTGTEATVRIVDFGIALETLTDTGSGTGSGGATPAYMAPEQLRNANNANETADLYAVSKIFYELIVGVLPSGHWQPPSAGRTDIPPGIDSLIEKGLSANRDNRPQSVATYREWLIRAMNNQPLPDPIKSDPTPGPTPTPPSPPKPGNPKLVLGLVGGCVAVLAIAGIWIASLDGEVIIDDPPPDNRIVSSGSFAKFNGRWEDGFGGYYNLTFDSSGTFEGPGALNDGSRVRMTGDLYNGFMDYQVERNGRPLVIGEATQTDACHFTFNSMDMNGNTIASGTFHAAHSPGAPCP